MSSDKLPHCDLLIRGGTVIDGTKAPRFQADVGIARGHIVAIGDLAGHSADEVVDAAGRIVAPGFIDSHTHDDQAVLSQPAMPFKVSQGVTTVVTGNCGISAAPLRDGMDLPMPLNLIDAPAQGRFTTFAAYLDALRATPSSVNVAAMVGHSTLRGVTMSELDRQASQAEISEMRAHVEEAMSAGAIGMSTGTFYATATQATTEEIIEVGRPLSARGALYVTHMRDESDRIMEAMEESFAIGRALGVPVVLSHHKAMHTPNFGKTRVTLPFIEETMKHQCVSLDCYPYTAGSTMIRTDRGMLDNRVLIASSEPHPECAGRDLADIAREWGLSKEEAARRLQPGSAIYFMMDEDDVQRVLAFDETMIGSDGIPLGDKPHPRLWGTFPRVLGHYSRDVGLFPLETAVWKMTGLTARNFGLHGRGTLKVGQHADIVVFDAATVRDAASYETPTRVAEGIDAVIVNGTITWQHGVHSGARSGQVITRRDKVAA
ncbi:MULTISPECIES: D-aminoacylase [unclassified Variovorax]|uniref:N-acyl-D-amino-acid deacylase family protein n=1 Tax=unclassified Variovorax TaxID=663243 RepID=UPI00076D0878|nr:MULTISPECIES: D-aminoacylase [unclassified Variovorax]KWT74703.1 D-aminoacylase-like protein [Variovorax sp. WDL1]PNG53087.1 D-aminoacylase [Variovorax sp. B2]PNG53659.1 D-aminoacylase [Variovorax sp. B4]VTV11097.1 D-aminoacylase [Variovorax sp. WDL1]